jgi:predicted nucleic acid-binding protein
VIVVDTAVIIDALVAVPRRAHVLARLSAEAELHAPHLIDLEFLQVLRSLVLAGALTADRAGDARVDYEELRIVRYPHQPLGDRIWELRDNVTAYDAAFVALAEILDAPLVTTDRRLARSSGHRAQIDLVDPGPG